MNRAVRRLVTALTGAVSVAILVAGCTTAVPGTAEYSPGGVKKSAKPSDMEIQNSDGSEIDQAVANALEDIFTFWGDELPEVFDKEFKEPAGGVYSYTADQQDPIPCFDGENEMAANNAFYCPPEDLIAFDREFLQELSDTYGPFLVTLVMAHEVGHLVQSQTSGLEDKAIALEGQADCYAGAFTKTAEDGTDHYKLTRADLDAVLGGYLLFRDEPGGSADDPASHGSGFDRVTAFQEGFFEGVEYCADAFGPDREYTEIPYDSTTEEQSQGNLEYDKTLEAIVEEMNFFGTDIAESTGDTWDNVGIEPIDGSASCDGKEEDDQVFYCADDKSVYYNDDDIAQQAYDKYGDFAVMELISLGYSDAILDMTGSEAKDAERFSAQLCLTGVYAGDAFEKTVQGEGTAGGLTLSAGDLDEAIAVLIGIGEGDEIMTSYDVDAFDRINSFRQGFNDGRENGPSVDGC